MSNESKNTRFRQLSRKDRILLICGILSVILAIGYIGYTYYESQVEDVTEIDKYVIPKQYKHKDSAYYQKYHKNHMISIPDKQAKQNIFDVSKEDYYVLFERTGCEYCKEARPVVRWYVDTNKEKSNMYFVEAEIDSKYGADTSSFIYTSKKDPTEMYLKGTNEENWWIPGTPTLFHIKNQQIKDIYTGPEQISKFLINQ